MNRTVSVITVNYNQQKATLALVENLLNQSGRPEILVVDNSDDPGQVIPEKSGVKVIRSRNNGYAAALNIGAAQACGDILVLINNDIRFPGNSYDCLVRQFSNQSSCEAVSPVIEDDGGRVEYAGYTAIHPLTGRNRADTDARGTGIRTTFYLHGACMVVRKEIWQQTKGLPEIYFLYYEEMEWSETIRKNGGRLGVALDCRVIHASSLSTSVNPEKTYFYQQRNRILFQRRHTSGIVRSLFLGYFLLVATPVNLIRNAFTGRPAFSRELLRAVHWNFTHPAT